MEIRPGRYTTLEGCIVVIQMKQEYPVPAWRGYIEGQSTQRSMWTDEGLEISGYRQWNLVERIEQGGRKES